MDSILTSFRTSTGLCPQNCSSHFRINNTTSCVSSKKAVGDASDKMTLEVSVATGYKGSATLPIPVVPIGAEASLSQTTKLTIDVNLKNYVLPEERKSLGATEPTRFILDLNTGLLE